MLELYAGTEANGITVITGPEWLEHPGSVGRPALGSSVKVLDRETGAELGPGEVGEVFLQPAGGPGTTYRYVGAEPRARGGFESLGDLGFLDEDGYLYLTDRTADLVVSGGSNVYPAEVEAALDSHPAVRSSVVFGVPDDDLGERVHALVDAPGRRDGRGPAGPRQQPAGPLQGAARHRPGRRAAARRRRQGAPHPAQGSVAR